MKYYIVTALVVILIKVVISLAADRVNFAEELDGPNLKSNVPEAVLTPYPDVKGNWVLQSSHSDEFNGSSLEKAKWDNDLPDWGIWSWEPGNAYVNKGYLRLRMKYEKHARKGKILYYKSGIVRSKAAPIKYGYFEARIKAARRQPGVCPAFWAFRQDPEKWTEIDFVELTQAKSALRRVDFNTHVFRYPGLKVSFHNRLLEWRAWLAPWDPAEDFHIYGCEWDATVIRWYVDGELRQTRENEFWNQGLDVVLSMGVRSPLDKVPSSDGFPTVMSVDYVRVWKKL